MLGIPTTSESLNEGLNPLPLLQKGWSGIKAMFSKEATDVAASTAGKDAAQTATSTAGKTATDVAGDTLTGSVVRKDGITWTQRADGIWQGVDKTGKQILKPNDQMQMMLGKVGGKTAAVQRTTAAVDDMVRGGVKARADDAAASVAGSAGSKVATTAATAENVQKLGGRFTNLVRNNKFLALLAALTAAGIIMNLTAGTDDPKKPDGPVGPVGPVTNPVQPQPAVDPQEEERKRQLTDLERLLARLHGGWPTDAETAETIKAAVAVGAKDPSGAIGNTGAVQTQPAADAPRIGTRTGVRMDTIGR
jgi:hypothetical protein